jgi:hypothetical protein
MASLPISNHHSFQYGLFNPDLVMEKLFQELQFFRFAGEDFDQVKVLSYTEN